MASKPSSESAPDALLDDYKKAGFTQRLGFGGKPALVIIDMVEAYLRPGSPLYLGAVADAVLDANRTLAAAARAAGVQVIFTGVRYAPGGRDGGHFYRKIAALSCFDAGNPLGDFSPTLAPEAGDLVILKQYASAFFGTTLAATLCAQGVDTCLIAGVSTSGCVRATGVDAIQHGFIPIIVREAVGDRDPKVHEANLFDLDAKYADVADLAAVTAYLEKLPRSLR